MLPEEDTANIKRLKTEIKNNLPNEELVVANVSEEETVDMKRLKTEIKNNVAIKEQSILNGSEEGTLDIKGLKNEIQRNVPEEELVVLNGSKEETLDIKRLKNEIKNNLPKELLTVLNGNEEENFKGFSNISEEEIDKTKRLETIIKNNLSKEKLTGSNGAEEKPVNKRLKTEIKNNLPKEKLIVNNVPNKPVERCNVCKQFLDSVLYYGGHPNYSNEEYIALTHENLSVYTGKEEIINEDDHPTHKITYFNVYDKNGHLCPFDTGLIENNVPLYFSGYIKPIYNEDSSPDDGIPAHDLGPIDEWWMAGYDGGEKLPIAFTTSFAQYYLGEPCPEYESIFKKVSNKTKLAKLVIEFLLEHAFENPKYEDLIDHVDCSGEFKNVEDTLLQNAQFICDQVFNIDQSSGDDDQPLYTLPCMRSLVQMAGVSFKKGKKFKPVKIVKEKKKNIMSKAVTTKLVQDVFEHFFPDQMDMHGELKGPKKKRCKVCEPCQSPDCGKCTHCLDMRKFGGSGKSKQACKRRRCMYMAIADAEMSDNEDEADLKDDKKIQKVKHVSNKVIHNVTWKEKASEKYKGYPAYISADLQDFGVQVGDFVMLKSKDEKDPLCIVKIIHMYDNSLQKKFHGLVFCRGTDSILGETADPRELFVVDDCDEYFAGSILRKAVVEYRKTPSNWFELGGQLNLEEQVEDDSETFYYSKRLENNRFVDLEFSPEDLGDSCYSCKRKALETEYNTPTFTDSCVKWRGEEYKVGTGVFLEPDVYNFETDLEIVEEANENFDATMYPEFYRKKSESVKGSNKDTPSPFVIGIIQGITEIKNKDIKVEVKIFFRPENTQNPKTAYAMDLNHVYYSEEIVKVSFDTVRGKCYITYGFNNPDPSEWADEGPHRFYFIEAYDPHKRKVMNVPTFAKNIGIAGKGKGGGKIKSKGSQGIPESLPVWENVQIPLRSMDVFAGCGGLSEGLKQSGVAQSRWAIEKEIPAANAYKLNNPDCKVFTQDCNDVLKDVFNGRAKELGLPEKGDVQILVGGPPCQGFSGMNRFNSRNYSSFKNSLVVSYLSYCEYYRPKYFILENVRNFVSFKKSMVLKLTLRCLLAMGYQVTFGILQAGQYGVPQTRRRLIIMAAAPGYKLPKYPEPRHVFNRKGTHLTFIVDNCSYYNECFWKDSAPHRTVTVRDAMSDLPVIKNGSNKIEIPYDKEPFTHFQRKIRGNDDTALLRDHICKEMSALVEARMSHIPTYPGADWRDLPNISLNLPDGIVTNILLYPYRTPKQQPTDKPRGVCQCVLKSGACDPTDKQGNTLIPWCLPHTGDRHNHWSGLYGRLIWDGYFGTTITNPEPMGKQGRVLHPEQNRVVGVRECARSQGFPDKFRFCGNILDKYRQVGNAVPPPLGAAIGQEIAKALNETLKTKN